MVFVYHQAPVLYMTADRACTIEGFPLALDCLFVANISTEELTEVSTSRYWRGLKDHGHDMITRCGQTSMHRYKMEDNRKQLAELEKLEIASLANGRRSLVLRAGRAAGR